MTNASSPPVLPPLEWLRVFDAAARSGSFTAAARELGLTQAAVSQRIRNLEARLGAPLFQRLPRGVELTTEGEAYAPHVRAAMTSLHRSTTDLFAASRRKLSVAAPGSAIECWIAPRLPALLRRFPELQITLTTVRRLTDYTQAGADLEVRFGDGDWPNRSARKMFDEVLAPVAAPELLHGAAEDWRRLPQIALSGPRDGWMQWAAAADVAPPRSPSLRFDTFSQALAAALAGAGVLLGSLEVLATELASGRLTRLPEPSARMEHGHWIAWAAGEAVDKEKRAVVDALCAGA